MSNQNASVELKFSINDCNLKNGFYYFIQVFRFSRMGEDACFRTEVVKKDNNILSFKPFSIHMQQLCNGDTVYIYIYYYVNSFDH